MTIASRLVAAIACLLPGLIASPRAAEVASPAEVWTLSALQAGEVADLGKYCANVGKPDASRDDPCHRLSARFLIRALTGATSGGEPIRSVRIVNATVDGDLDLSDARFDRALEIKASALRGDVILTDAWAGARIEIEDSTLAGKFDASSLRSSADVALVRDDIAGVISLAGANIAGPIDLSGSHCADRFEATFLQGSILLALPRGERASTFKNVDLVQATFSGPVNFIGAKVEGGIAATGLSAQSLGLLSLRENVASFGSVDLTGSKIAGSVNMAGAQVIGATSFSSAEIGGYVNLRDDGSGRARFDSIEMIGSRIGRGVDGSGANVAGPFSAAAAEISGDFLLAPFEDQPAIFAGLDLKRTKISGALSLVGANASGPIDLNSAFVGGLLLFRAGPRLPSRFTSIDLTKAKVDGQVEFNGAIINGELNASGAVFGDNVAAADSHFQTVVLANARIAQSGDFSGAEFSGDVNATKAVFGGDLLFNARDASATKLRALTLDRSEIGGNFEMIGADAAGHIAVDSLSVKQNAFLRGAHAHAGVAFAFAKIASNFDVRGASLSRLDLSGAQIGGEFRLDGKGANAWRDAGDEKGGLVLRSAHVGALIDAVDAWPPAGHLTLEGFSFDAMGGFEGGSATEMRARGMAWWDKWARADEHFSPSPYLALVGALSKSSDTDAANDIRYMGRERERENACAVGVWGDCFLLSVLNLGAGYGIGLHTFRVLLWLALYAAIGAFVLWKFSPAAREANRGRLWCIGASLSRLLPGIEFNREFTAFFDDPERQRLNRWQAIFFSAYVIFGWLLVGLLVVAIGELTHAG